MIFFSNKENEKTDYNVNHKKINKLCFYFDLETLKLAKQKFPEFSIIQEFHRADKNQNLMIYILGEYSSFFNIKKIICFYVQFGNYFH